MIKKLKTRPEKFRELKQLLNKTENTIRCDYFEIDQFKKVKIKQQDFLLHLNMSSLSSHINGLLTFLNLFEIKFDKICITESRFLQKTYSQARSISLDIMLNIPQQRPLLVGGGVSDVHISDIAIYSTKRPTDILPQITRISFYRTYNFQINYVL